ncbi:DUF2569 domain-containing protein [Paenibacillus peoriae]|uniref:DUF2569 domain-containing protein n=1 Tax=Paenibacillus peoriae TaxID=59893 RepID=UPI00215AAB3F|nr:DUF2569 domain-containing protein [Paenibacillus peoriae]
MKIENRDGLLFTEITVHFNGEKKVINNIVKRKGPNIIIQIEIITIIFGFLNFILTINKIDELPSLISTIIFGSIWILYFKNSKRVKATFES